MAVITEQSTALHTEFHKYSHHYGNSIDTRLECDLCDLTTMTSESVREEIQRNWMTGRERGCCRWTKDIIVEDSVSGADVRNISCVWYEDMMRDRYSVKTHLEECAVHWERNW